LDLIYDIPQIPVSSIASSLKELIKLAPEHISAYSYSPDTGYLATEPSHDPYQTEMVTNTLQAEGYLRYELSNYALAGHEAKHNLKYWKMQPYIGIGASAHSMIYDADGAHIRWQHGELDTYLQNSLRRDGLEQYTREDSLKEALVFGLRQLAGVDLAELSSRYGCLPADLASKVQALCKQGMLIREGEQLRASAKGLLLLNSVMEYLW
jgi:oxygen-independent coproporphyrinogen-3 oxidase